MPIAEELDNLRKFEFAGFTHEQSEIPADVIGKAQERIKEFFTTN